MKKVYLIRHAAYSNPNNILPGRLPLPLSEEGIQQAEKLAVHLSQFSFDAIYSSQVLRAQQTAEAIQKKQIENQEIKFDKRILETQTAYQGFWEPNVFEGGVHYFAHRDKLGGENLEDVQKRMISFWNEKIVESSEETIAIVSHDFCILTLLKYLKDSTS